MNSEEYTCKDCKYYYYDEEYCTHIFYKNFKPNQPICDLEWFEKGVFNERFYILAEPLQISTGSYYVIVDRENELVDSDGNFIDFKYDDEAEIICNFLNKQNNRIKRLQKIFNEEYYANKIEEEYWSNHTPITD